MAKNDARANRKVWFVTGSSRGFGRHWVEAALARGDAVAATARNPDSVADLSERYGDAVLPLALDVTNRKAVFDAVARVHSHFGRLDVVVNNAGYGLFGAIEEITEAQARAQLDANLFGALWVTQAVLPIFRQQRSGRILQVSSIGGVLAFPILGLYHASKWALEGFSDALAQEVAQFGIRVTLIEPGAYGTDWRGSSAVWAEPIDGYAALREARRTPIAKSGDPAATAPAILKIVDADDPPLRFFLGAVPFELVKDVYAKRLEAWAQWMELSRSAQGT